MKYLLIFLISFVFALPVLAAKEVGGAVPQVLPLQPPPAGIYPSGNKNIEYLAPTYKDSSVAGSDNNSIGQSGNPQTGSNNGFDPATLPAPQPEKPNRLFVWLAAILALGIFSWVFYNKNKE